MREHSRGRTVWEGAKAGADTYLPVGVIGGGAVGTVGGLFAAAAIDSMDSASVSRLGFAKWAVAGMAAGAVVGAGASTLYGGVEGAIVGLAASGSEHSKANYQRNGAIALGALGAAGGVSKAIPQTAKVHNPALRGAAIVGLTALSTAGGALTGHLIGGSLAARTED